MGQPGSSNRLGTSSSELPKLLVHSGVDLGPEGGPVPEATPQLPVDFEQPRGGTLAGPLLSHLRSAPSQLERVSLRTQTDRVFWEKFAPDQKNAPRVLDVFFPDA